MVHSLPRSHVNRLARECDLCGGEGRVMDTRPDTGNNYVRRRRYCSGCKVRWTTIEMSTARVEQLVNAMTGLTTARGQLIKLLEVITSMEAAAAREMPPLEGLANAYEAADLINKMEAGNV